MIFIRSTVWLLSQHNKNSFLLYIHVKTTYTAILMYHAVMILTIFL